MGISGLQHHIHGTPPTSEPRFELEAAGVSIEVRPVLDKSICRAEAAVQENVGPTEVF